MLRNDRMTDNYGYPIIKIDELEQVVDGENDYCYRDARFLYCNRRMRNLLITFHGAAKEGMNRPIFRLYNRHYKNTDTLALTDFLINRDKKCLLGWFRSTQKHNFETIYQEIIGFFVDRYDKVLFFGSSGGGYPALKYSCIYNAGCIIGNSQIYLDKYKYYPKITEILAENDDYLLEESIEEIIKHNPPKVAILYCNKEDKHHYEEHYQPFQQYCIQNGLRMVKINYFEAPTTETSNAHSIYFPTKLPKIILFAFAALSTNK